MTTVAEITTAAAAHKGNVLTWETIAAREWHLIASEGNRFQYRCPEIAALDANLVVEFAALDGENEWGEIEFAYYADNTGAEWCYPSE